MRITILVFIAFFPLVILGQNKVTGKVIDELGLPIYRDSVSIEQTDQITYTNYEGVFTLKSEKDFHWKINIKSKGYKTESFFVLDGGKTEALILEYDLDMKKILTSDSSKKP